MPGKYLHSKWRITVVLILALMCIYASQLIPMRYGISKRTFALELVLFMVIATPVFLFCDLLLNRVEKRATKSIPVFYSGLVCVSLEVFVDGYYHSHFFSWCLLIMYSLYFFRLVYKAHTAPAADGSKQADADKAAFS